MTTNLVEDIFGPVFQGEGHMAGAQTIFVRFGGCDYRCSWCDSLYAVLPKFKHNWTKMTPTEIVERIKELDTGGVEWITFSGGNPLIQDLFVLMDEIHKAGYLICVENQGTYKGQFNIDDLIQFDFVSLSPKPPSSGMTTDYDMLDSMAEWIITRTVEGCFKVVVFDDNDFEYAVNINKRYPSIPLFLSAGNEAVNTQDDIFVVWAVINKTKWLEEKVVESGLKASVLPQVHVLLHGNKKGK